MHKRTEKINRIIRRVMTVAFLLCREKSASLTISDGTWHDVPALEALDPGQTCRPGSADVL